MNFINNYVQLKYFEELAGLIVFSVILAGYAICIAITYLRKLFKSRRKKQRSIFNRTLLLCIPSGWDSCLGETQLIKKVNQPLPSVSQQAVINAHSPEVIDHN